MTTFYYWRSQHSSKIIWIYYCPLCAAWDRPRQMDKLHLVPSTSQIFTGYKLLSRAEDGYPSIQISAERIHQLQKDIKRVLRRDSVTATVLARICGQCIFMGKACSLARQTAIAQCVRTHFAQRQRDTWSHRISLDDATKQDF